MIDFASNQITFKAHTSNPLVLTHALSSFHVPVQINDPLTVAGNISASGNITTEGHITASSDIMHQYSSELHPLIKELFGMMTPI